MKKIITILCTVLLLASCGFYDKENTTNHSIDSFYEEISKLADEHPEDVRYQSIIDFMNKDIEKYILSNDQNNNELLQQCLEEFNRIEVDNCSVTINNDELFFSCEYLNSTDHFLKGVYKYKIVRSIIGGVIWQETDDNIPEEYNTVHDLSIAIAARLNDDFFLNTTGPLDVYSDAAIFYTVYYISHDKLVDGYKISENVMKNNAMEIFGITDYIPLETTATKENGLYIPAKVAGLVKERTIKAIEEKGETVSITYQFYADKMNFIKSDIVKISFEKANNSFGYRFTSAEIIYDSDLPVYKYYC